MADTIRVLYVDDEPSLLALGKRSLLESGDFSITTAESASEGLDLLKRENFDAIVSDYQMPGMDGIQFLIEVRTKFGSVPFILFTGRGREEVVIQAINNGVDFYIQKGGDPVAQYAELAHKIRLAVERYTLNIVLKESEVRFRSLIRHDCRTLVATAAKEAPLGKVKVKYDLPANAEVFADPLIFKVFYNLLDNAVRYGGKITTIRFSIEELGGDKLIVCEDDGEGISSDEKEKIFKHGFGKNTGLGLALSREILDITGITIRETGEPGKGARFEMTVPKGVYRINMDIDKS